MSSVVLRTRVTRGDVFIQKRFLLFFWKDYTNLGASVNDVEQQIVKKANEITDLLRLRQEYIARLETEKKAVSDNDRGYGPVWRMSKSAFKKAFKQLHVKKPPDDWVKILNPAVLRQYDLKPKGHAGSAIKQEARRIKGELPQREPGVTAYSTEDVEKWGYSSQDIPGADRAMQWKDPEKERKNKKKKGKGGGNNPSGGGQQIVYVAPSDPSEEDD